MVIGSMPRLLRLLFDFLEAIGLVFTLIAWAIATGYMLASPYWTAKAMGAIMLAITAAACIPLLKGARASLRAFVSWRRSRRKTNPRRTTWFPD